MTENLKIEFFRNGVQELINNLSIPVGTCLLCVKDLEKQLEVVYQQQIEKEYKEYQEEMEKQAKEKEEKKEKEVEKVEGEVVE